MRKNKGSILYTGKRTVDYRHCQHWEGQETRLELQVCLEEPKFHTKGNRHLGKGTVRLVARSCHPGSEIGPTWHRAKGLHGESMKFSILLQSQTMSHNPSKQEFYPFQ